MWAVLRVRIPRGRWFQQLRWELGVGAALGLAMAFGVLGLAALLGWDAVWRQSSLRSSLTFLLLLLGIGPGYVLTRGVIRLGRYWNRLRRRRMVWGLTHALLTVALVVGGIMVLIMTFLGPIRYLLSDPTQAENLGTLLAERFFQTLFPTTVVALGAGIVMLLFMLPPAALFSYITARKTTRRLKALTHATRALRTGDYSLRTEVQGEDEVAQLQADFNAMADELERTLAKLAAERDKVETLLSTRRELIASVSHELRTPIATLRGYLESLQRSAATTPPETLAHDLTVMEDEIKRLQRLIDDLFTLSQAETTGLSLTLTATQLPPVIRRRVNALAPLAWERDRVELTMELPETLPDVCVDVGRFEQLLTNLLRNALRHTNPGGIVAVVAAAEPDAVRVEVRDTGTGISPEALPHVWERFYRGEEARARDARGAGLGLALVKELTEAMGGRVAVESTPGEGSTFSVWLPRCEDHVPHRRTQ
jgi:signal transduction histidine kinase